MNEELRKALQDYYNRFGDRFPTFELGFESNEELIEMINKCLKLNKPANIVFNIVYNLDHIY